MSDETKKECKHQWIGDTCCQCGIGWHVYADDAIKERDQLRAELDLSAEPDPNGTMAARLNWWKVESDELNEKWAETRRQLDAVTKERDADKARLDWLFAETQIRRTVYTATPLHKFATDQIICDRSDIDAAIANIPRAHARVWENKIQPSPRASDLVWMEDNRRI